ncbi:hypothetical protein EGR_06379 [Echinococcus granulosus]|uniref:Uncharacterized protein n=1 Tax=Echinococcus granulosus TaxID=6210 RepID=W6UBG0_ECHGR|nr:hypothetical protein EGR_06379 [Echinococcus granulosus]EUB58708.1 hypothetical protein EGR_06379 [Echinococcus granulosus]
METGADEYPRIHAHTRSNHDQTPSPKAFRKSQQKPCFEDRIKTTFIVDEADPFLSPTEVTEPLHEEDSDGRGSADSQSRRKQWLRQAISVDGERVPAKLLHQCSLDRATLKNSHRPNDCGRREGEPKDGRFSVRHGYIGRSSSIDKDSTNGAEVTEDSAENDLEDLQSQRALVEAELRRQAKAPPGLKIRDLLACRSITEDEGDDDDDEEEAEKAKGEGNAQQKNHEKEDVTKTNNVEGERGLDVSGTQVKLS